jgi:hypothetical protein
MKVSKLLTEVLLKKFCESLEEELNEAEAPSSGLTALLNEAKIKVFDKYKINPETRTYFLAGSARLYLYPKVQEVMNVKPIGDLDIVIPSLPTITKELAKTSTTTDTTTNKTSEPIKIIKPGEKVAITNEIEIFDKWDPTKAKPEGAKDFSVRSTNDILKDAKLVNGYYYMSLFDVMDYKLNLNRDKEKNLTIYLSNYLGASDEQAKNKIKEQILQVFADDSSAATDFLKPAVLKQKQSSSTGAPPSSPSAEPKQTPPTQQKQAEK